MICVKQGSELLMDLGTATYSPLVFSLNDDSVKSCLLQCILPGLQEGKLKLSSPHGCPSRIYKLMLRCWASSPKDRVSFSDIVTALSDLPSESKV